MTFDKNEAARRLLQSTCFSQANQGKYIWVNHLTFRMSALMLYLFSKELEGIVGMENLHWILLEEDNFPLTDQGCSGTSENAQFCLQ